MKITFELDDKKDNIKYSSLLFGEEAMIALAEIVDLMYEYYHHPNDYPEFTVDWIRTEIERIIKEHNIDLEGINVR